MKSHSWTKSNGKKRENPITVFPKVSYYSLFWDANALHINPWEFLHKRLPKGLEIKPEREHITISQFIIKEAFKHLPQIK